MVQEGNNYLRTLNESKRYENIYGRRVRANI